MNVTAAYTLRCHPQWIQAAVLLQGPIAADAADEASDVAVGT